MAVDLELTWQHLQSEFRPKQNERCLCKSISPFTMGLYHVCMAARMISHIIHIGLIATTRASLITSFQPPLRLRQLHEGQHRSPMKQALMLNYKSSLPGLTLHQSSSALNNSQGILL